MLDRPAGATATGPDPRNFLSGNDPSLKEPNIDTNPPLREPDSAAQASEAEPLDVQVDTSQAVVRWRSWQNDVQSAPFATFPLHLHEVLTSRPWRETLAYRSRKPQFSGRYAPCKPSQVGDPLHFESRLERSAQIEGDRDRTVVLQRAQPFQIAVRVNGRTRVHTPDLLRVMTTGALALVDVKPAAKAAGEKAKIARAIAASLCRSLGWDLLDYNGEPVLRRVNLGWLAGYRRETHIDPAALAAARALVHDNWPHDREVLLGQALAAAPLAQRSRLRAALMHLLWSGELGIDLAQPLTVDSPVWQALPPLMPQPAQSTQSTQSTQPSLPEQVTSGLGHATERLPGGTFAPGHREARP